MAYPNPPQVAVYEPIIGGGNLPDKPLHTIQRKQLVLQYPNNTESKPFYYDIVTRPNQESVTVVPWFTKNEKLYVVLRSCIRPPLLLADSNPNQWELPAGMHDQEKPFLTAEKELFEETGFRPINIVQLGPAIHTSVGMSPERMHFFSAKVDPDRREAASTDGGPLEQFGELWMPTLDQAMNAIRDGFLIDSKTEIGLRRLEEQLDELC
jgi:ADP-ribose pyrophosphatase